MNTKRVFSAVVLAAIIGIGGYWYWQTNTSVTTNANQNEQTFPVEILVLDGAILDSSFTKPAKIEVSKGTTLVVSTTTQEGQSADPIFNLSPGQYTVSVKSEGYIDGVFNINVKEKVLGPNPYMNVQTWGISLNPIK